MEWYAIDKNYVSYLKEYDKFVPKIEYTGRMKCFLGVVLIIDGKFEYFAPITSYKEKFNTMNNDIDFYKIINENGKIYGAININNMIPVPRGKYEKITEQNLDLFRNFKNKRERKSYWKLLQNELKCINEEILLHNAKKLYKFVQDKPDSTLAKRCCNFNLLEEKCIKYIMK